MKRILLLSFLCLFSIGAMATSTPSGEKERKGHAEVSPSMASPAPSTLQGELSEEMMAKEPIAETSSPVPISIEKTSESRSRTAPSEPVVHFKSKKKENRFLKRVEKIRNRIFRRQEGGGAVLGILAMMFGLLGFMALIVAPFAAIAGVGIGVLLLAGVLGLAGLILGAVGLGGPESGKPFAIVGLIFGILTTMVFLIAIMIIAALDGL